MFENAVRSGSAAMFGYKTTNQAAIATTAPTTNRLASRAVATNAATGDERQGHDEGDGLDRDAGQGDERRIAEERPRRRRTRGSARAAASAALRRRPPTPALRCVAGFLRDAGERQEEPDEEQHPDPDHDRDRERPARQDEVRDERGAGPRTRVDIRHPHDGAQRTVERARASSGPGRRRRPRAGQAARSASMRRARAPPGSRRGRGTRTAGSCSSGTGTRPGRSATRRSTGRRTRS